MSQIQLKPKIAQIEIFSSRKHINLICVVLCACGVSVCSGCCMRAVCRGVRCEICAWARGRAQHAALLHAIWLVDIDMLIFVGPSIVGMSLCHSLFSEEGVVH